MTVGQTMGRFDAPLKDAGSVIRGEGWGGSRFPDVRLNHAGNHRQVTILFGLPKLEKKHTQCRHLGGCEGA